MTDIMISIDRVCKRYRLGQIGSTTLRDELQRVSARLHHREDPTRLIGSRTYASGETFLALDNVSFDVKPGERVGVIGRNGSGKSTLLKLISRVTAPTSGRIGLNGRVASMLEVGTGFHGELTGRENIYMNGAILGMSRREINRKMEDIIEFSECRPFIDTPVKRYSSGMYVKLAFSVAAHLDSEIMIMDEVLAVGDMAFQNKCLSKMNEVSQSQGRTILYVSHNMNTIRQLCNKCVVLNQGKLIYDGEVEEAIQLYMSASERAFERELDLSRASHGKYASRKILFTRALVEEENNHYASYEEMGVTFHLEATEDYERVRLMLILFHQDGTRLAKTESESFSVRKGSNEIHAKIPLEGLADGAYYYEISLLQYGNYNVREKADYVSNTLPFYIYNSEVFGVKGEKWRSNYWGHFMMKPIRITDSGADRL